MNVSDQVLSPSGGEHELECHVTVLSSTRPAFSFHAAPPIVRLYSPSYFESCIFLRDYVSCSTLMANRLVA
jgi:hypothetical protein